MKRLPLLALALLLSLGASDLALAGSAQPGGTRTVTLKPTPVTQPLVGRWKLVGVEMNGKPMPLPGSLDMVFELRADGTAAAYKNGQARPVGKIGRWSATKDALQFRTSNKRKPESLRYWLRGDSLTLEPPTKAQNMRLRLQRIRAPRP